MTLSSPGTSKVAKRIDTHLVFVQRSRKRKHRDKKKLESCDVRLLKCQKCTLGKTTLTNIKKHPKNITKHPKRRLRSRKSEYFSFSDFVVFFRFWSILEHFWSTRVSNRSARSADKQRRRRKRRDNLFSRIMFLPAIEQYKLSVISYFHVETAKTREKKQILLLTKNDTDLINYLEKCENPLNHHLEKKIGCLRFSEENSDDGRFYNRSNLQVSPKNNQTISLFSILLLKINQFFSQARRKISVER